MKARRKHNGAGRPDPGDGAFALYLDEIRAHPILTRAEEADLARRIRQGDQMALENLVRSNLRFVVTVARRYQNLGLSLGDLVAEGNVGLVRAAQKFDETRGVKFISYAVWWIRQAILKALAETARSFRLPVNQATMANRISRREAELAQRLGRDPRPEEVADSLGIDVDELVALSNASRDSIRLDGSVWDDEEKTLVQYLEDDSTPGPEEDTEDHARTARIQRILSTLDPREARILRLYFGLDGDAPLTLREIGAIYSLSRERVRQIKQRALDRMARGIRGRRIEPFA